MAPQARNAHIWRHPTTFGDIEIIARTGSGRPVCELWLAGRRLDQRGDAAELVRRIASGWYDALVGWPLSRMGVPTRLGQWREGGDYDLKALVPAFVDRFGCDPTTMAA